MRRIPHFGHRAQAGQALTEFIVLALALLPLFLLMPLIAKYQDISHFAQVASRYVAFDATVRNDATGSWKEEHRLASEVRQRFFASPEAGIRTNAETVNAGRNIFWQGPNEMPLIADSESDVTLSFGTRQGLRHVDAFDGSRYDRAYTLANAFGVNDRGIYTANIRVTLANMPPNLRQYVPFNAINLQMTRSTSVLLDSWAARGPIETEARVGGDADVFPAAALRRADRGVGAMVSAMEIGRVRGPKLGQLDFWRDVVPRDRLK